VRGDGVSEERSTVDTEFVGAVNENQDQGEKRKVAVEKEWKR
jgi:hypothetical protein